MATILFRSILIVVLTLYVFGDEIEMEVQSGTILKMLREMVNQTGTDTLSLPANSTSIRENITDTFSCENRTYGYYADVDNECQIFHVCVPTQTPSGRNVTYKYSFICPKDTVFNQEVLVCTWERDALPCEESPNFYDLNMEIGKIADPEISKESEKENEVETIPTKKETRQPNRKKQNIIMEALLKEAEEIEPLEETLEEVDSNVGTYFETSESKPPVEEVKTESSDSNPSVEKVKIEPNGSYPSVVEDKMETNENKPSADDFNIDERIGNESNLRREGRMISRGSKKFSLNV
ncbi:unnamed protein product [Euphydryas editha]|uniref:Chitin-binding type-2 domain-containing protein n=1 Tax=Euphydryas editha TaxID=104508 RepID=A0AAU9TCT9_EUPED|nr:unnamed protein product [Euphydryas editha]